MIDLQLLYVCSFEFTDKENNKNVKVYQFIDKQSLKVFNTTHGHEDLKPNKIYVCHCKIVKSELKIDSVALA